MSFGADAPDYEGAAEKQGQSSIAAINAQTLANRPTMITPWGRMDWSKGDDGSWTGQLSLSDAQQKALDSQQSIQQNQSALAQNLQGRAADALGQPMDWDGFQSIDGGMQQARDSATGAVYDQAMSRINPQYEQQNERMRAQILAAGGDPNSAAAGAEYGRVDRAYNDARDTALRSAITMGGQEGQRNLQMNMATRQQQISEALQKRAQPLNEMQAVMNGQQVAMPQMPGFAQAGAAQPTNYLGAAQAQGQFDLANSQMQNQLLAGAVGGASQMGAAYFGNPFAF